MERCRWPDGIRCALCGSSDVAGSPSCRRCRSCRRAFTWRTRTALHATKLSASTWLAAARAGDATPSAVIAATGVSAPTARRVCGLLRTSGGPAATTPEQRLSALLASPRPAPRKRKGASPAVAPPRTSRAQRMLDGLTASELSVFNALRHCYFGASAASVAALSGISLGHTRRCLRRFEQLQIARRDVRACPWGYALIRRTLWRLTFRNDCAIMMTLTPRTPTLEIPNRFPDMVPPQYWSLFWSGTPADELRISRDATTIAAKLLADGDTHARLWALTQLPVDALREVRGMRGYDTGENASSLDSFIGARDA